MTSSRAHAGDRRGAGGATPNISTAEWIAVAIAAIIVVGAIATLLVHATHPSSPPDLVVTIDAVEPSSAGFLVGFTIENRGGKTAAQVIVRGTLGAGAERETPEVVFDYVPDGSRRRGGLLFAHDPRRGDLTVRALGYREP